MQEIVTFIAGEPVVLAVAVKKVVEARSAETLDVEKRVAGGVTARSNTRFQIDRDRCMGVPVAGRIDTAPAVEPVGPRSANQFIVTAIAVENVGSAISFQKIRKLRSDDILDRIEMIFESGRRANLRGCGRQTSGQIDVDTETVPKAVFILIVDGIDTVAAVDKVGARAARQLVIAVAAGQDIVAVTAIEVVVAVVAGQNVMALAAVNMVPAVSSIQKIVVRAAIQTVVAAFAIKEVDARPTPEAIISRTTPDPIRTTLAIEEIDAVISEHQVVNTRSVMCVGPFVP